MWATGFVSLTYTKLPVAKSRAAVHTIDLHYIAFYPFATSTGSTQSTTSIFPGVILGIAHVIFPQKDKRRDPVVSRWQIHQNATEHTILGVPSFERWNIKNWSKDTAMVIDVWHKDTIRLMEGLKMPGNGETPGSRTASQRDIAC